MNLPNLLRTGFVALLLLICIRSTKSELTFYAENGTSIGVYEVAQLFLGDNAELAEPFINYTSIYVDQVLSGQNFSGFVVLTPTVNPIETTIRLSQQNGAIAVVMVYAGIYRPGRSVFNVDGSRGAGITIHAFEAGSEMADALPSIYTSDTTQVIISIQSTGNIWLSIPDNHIDVAFSIVIGLGSGWCVGLAIYKLVLFQKKRGKFSKDIPQTCLTLHLVANLLRFIYVVLDPLGFRRIWTFYADNILYTISYPITIIASLLMSLYWVEAMTSASLTVYPGLRNMKKPFIIFSVALAALEIASDIIRTAGVVGASLTVTITVIIYLICIAGQCIFYLIASTLLLKRMKASQAVTNKANFLKRVTWLIIISVIFFWIFFFCVVAFIFPIVAGTIPGWLTLNFVAMLSFIGVSTCQTLVFNPRASKSSASSKGKKDISDTSTAMTTVKSVN